MLQVLLNLIVRAKKSMLPREDRLLTIVSGREDDRVHDGVVDTGMGDGDAKRDRIFAARFPTKRNGSGMGLSISRSSFEFHRGRRTMTSRQEHGSAFRVILPAQTGSGL